jgi:hypothetical protein
MVTSSSPIWRDEAAIGVVDARLVREVLRGAARLARRVARRRAELRLRHHRSGVFISHPHRDYDFARVRHDVAPRLTGVENAEAAGATLTQLLRQDGTGSGAALDPAMEKQSAFLFAPVPSADWKFVVVECEESTPACG